MAGKTDHGRRCSSGKDGVVPQSTEQHLFPTIPKNGLRGGHPTCCVKIIKIEGHAVGKLRNSKPRTVTDNIGEKDRIASCSNLNSIHGKAITGIKRGQIVDRNPGSESKTIDIGKTCVILNHIHPISRIKEIGVAALSTVQHIMTGSTDERVITGTRGQSLTSAEPQQAIMGEGSE